jgi:hypothetical protein
MTTGVIYIKTKPALPNEIQDRILDFLYDSKPTLKACSLVCKTWVPTSRYHLFSKITLRGRDARSCQALLKNPNCTIQSCVHFSASLDDSETTANVANVLQYLSPSSLHIQQIPDDLLHWHTLASFPPLPFIERLEVGSGCKFRVAELFVTFPNIRELRIACSPMDLPRFNTASGDISICPPQLRSLEFSKAFMDPLLRWFMEKRIVPTNLFCINDLTSAEVSIVGEYFSMFGNVLQEIRIGFFRDYGDEPDVLGMSNFTLRSVLTHILFPSEHFRDQARLQSLTGLQSLTLDNSHDLKFSTHHIDLLVPILEEIPSHTIKRLRFDLFIPLESPRIIGWHRIGEVLQQKRFSHLTEVVFVLDVDNDEGRSYGPIDHVEKWIREDLHMLEERGILYVRPMYVRLPEGVVILAQYSQFR